MIIIRSRKNGFTLLEIMVVVGIFAVIVTISAGALKSMYRNTALKTSMNEVYRAFTDARNQTLASVGDTVYGVMVGTSSVTRFVGSTYSVGTSTNKVSIFDAGVTATGSLVSGGIPVIFKRLTGEPSATGTITLQNNTGSATETLNIYTSGLVEY